MIMIFLAILPAHQVLLQVAADAVLIPRPLAAIILLALNFLIIILRIPFFSTPQIHSGLPLLPILFIPALLIQSLQAN